MPEKMKPRGLSFGTNGHFGTQFQPGNHGRLHGVRNKLSGKFIKALADDFDEHGAATIERVRREDPVSYVRLVAGLLPRDLSVLGEDGETGLTIKIVSYRADDHSSEPMDPAHPSARPLALS